MTEEYSPLRPSHALAIENLQGNVSPLDRSFRAQSTTIALLREAYNKIENADRIIAEQEKRIRQLEDLAATDPLTGLMNRRGFESFFARELARIRRQNSPGALFVIVDLDRFKPLNDMHGHQAGDAALKFIAEHMLKSIRFVDGAARLGGDEFALLLTQTEPERAMMRVHEIRKMLNDLRCDWDSAKLHIGASFGVAAVTAESEYASVYNTADRALYEEKKLRQQV